MNTATVKMKSRVLFMSTEITVLLPESYEKDMACKVLWLLHGASGDNAVGTEDLFYEPVRRFKTYADELGADQVEYDFAPGFGHSGKLWDIELEKVIQMFGI